jgi:GDP-L-fucose synthase
LAYRTLIPCNLYGPGDAFVTDRSHLVAAVIAKMTDAVRDKQGSVEIWGDGEARREFLYVEDLAAFMLEVLPRLAELPPMLNVGALEDHTVNEYYQVAAEVLGYRGEFHHDLTRPVGMKRKLMDSRRAVELGWRPTTSLAEGFRLTAESYLRSV